MFAFKYLASSADSAISAVDLHRGFPLPRPRHPRTRRGSIIVEAVFALVFLTLMVAGVIQYSMYLHTMSTVNEYAREGARYTMEHYADLTFNPTEFTSYMQGVATSQNVPYSDLTSVTITIPWNSKTKEYDYTNGTTTQISNTVCSSNCVELTKGNIFTVNVTYDLTKRNLFFPLIPGLPTTYTAKVAMIAE